MKSGLKKLYSETIKQLAGSQRHVGGLTDPTFTIKAHNPMCGDDFRIDFELKENKIHAIRFEGYGCSLSKASTALLAKKVEGMHIEDVEKYLVQYLRVADPAETKEPEAICNDSEVLAFAMSRQFPERHTCVTMGWKAFQDHFINQKS